MKTTEKTTYPALERASSGDHFLPGKRRTGFVIFFIAVVMATVWGMVVFLLFVSTELSCVKDPRFAGNREMRALFPRTGYGGGRKTAPFFNVCENEEDTDTATPHQ